VSVLGGLGLALFFGVQLVAVILIPLGLPGTFVQVAAAAVLALATGGARLGWGWVGVFLALALVGELVEFVAGLWGARRFGGTRAAAWGALVGGIVGAFVGGIPVPIVGAIVMSFVGTFVGALVGEMWGQRAVAPDLRVGAGALLGRALGVGTKLALGMTIVVVSGVVVLGR